MKRIYKHRKRIIIQPQVDTPSFRYFCENISASFVQAKSVLKNDATSTVWVTSINNCPVVVKRINPTPLWHQVRRRLTSNRTRYNWQNAKRLRALNIPTFNPLAMIETWWGPSYTVTSFVEGKNAFQLLSEEPQSWPYYAEQLAQLVLQLHRFKVRHRDLNPYNLIWCQGRWHVIDLDAMRSYGVSFLSNFYLKRECERLLDNWQDTFPQHPEFVQILMHTLQKAVYTDLAIRIPSIL